MKIDQRDSVAGRDVEFTVSLLPILNNAIHISKPISNGFGWENYKRTCTVSIISETVHTVHTMINFMGIVNLAGFHGRNCSFAKLLFSVSI